MKTIIISKEGNETIGEILECEDEKQKAYIFEHYLQGTNIIYTIDIDGFGYLQYKNKLKNNML